MYNQNHPMLLLICTPCSQKMSNYVIGQADKIGCINVVYAAYFI